ncbi:hypothetical protein NAPIS_ORF01771 [Vairimorpha apis BRL 01]|uniref:Uncharacterized protein n=1 Tax=Vairimorpha apis BRL 01 TaxID=1037528 RepID=T0L861_9MICR|nr:hypothetical protein NAPIS_ORF01771 [Vairimorpha apis BRL 01]
MIILLWQQMYFAENYTIQFLFCCLKNDDFIKEVKSIERNVKNLTGIIKIKNKTKKKLIGYNTIEKLYYNSDKYQEFLSEYDFKESTFLISKINTQQKPQNMSFKKEKLYMKINSYKKKRTRCERTTMENIALNSNEEILTKGILQGKSLLFNLFYNNYNNHKKKCNTTYNNKIKTKSVKKSANKPLFQLNNTLIENITRDMLRDIHIYRSVNMHNYKISLRLPRTKELEYINKKIKRKIELLCKTNLNNIYHIKAINIEHGWLKRTYNEIRQILILNAIYYNLHAKKNIIKQKRIGERTCIREFKSEAMLLKLKIQFESTRIETLIEQLKNTQHSKLINDIKTFFYYKKLKDGFKNELVLLKDSSMKISCVFYKIETYANIAKLNEKMLGHDFMMRYNKSDMNTPSLTNTINKKSNNILIVEIRVISINNLQQAGTIKLVKYDLFVNELRLIFTYTIRLELFVKTKFYILIKLVENSVQQIVANKYVEIRIETSIKTDLPHLTICNNKFRSKHKKNLQIAVSIIDNSINK